jgi:hypothetical protein
LRDVRHQLHDHRVACRFCWLGLNRPGHAAWSPDPTAPKPPPVKRRGCGGCNKQAFTVATPTPTVDLSSATAGPAGLPGTELTLLIRSLGFPLCQTRCRELAQQMDEWGPWGSWANKDAILEQLRATQKRLKWTEKLMAASRAITTGLAFKLDPADPAPGLLKEAIRRAIRHGEDPILLTRAED